MRRARIREGALWGAKIVSTFPEWAGLQAKPNFRHPHVQRGQRPRPRRLDRCLEIGPGRRDQRAAAARAREGQLEPSVPAHPAHQLERTALQWMTRTDDPHRRREAVEVGSVSCLLSTRSTARS